jgi:hypothetical protein
MGELVMNARMTETLRVYIAEVDTLGVARLLAHHMENEAQKPEFQADQYRVKTDESGNWLYVTRTYDVRY